MQARRVGRLFRYSAGDVSAELQGNSSRDLALISSPFVLSGLPRFGLMECTHPGRKSCEEFAL